MSAEENKAIYHRWAQEVFNRGDLSVVDELIDPSFVDRAPALPGQAPGAEGVKQVFTLYRTAFPDIQATIEDLIAEGDKVVARLTVRGTHPGELQGIPATGKQATITAIDIVRIANGKFVEHWAQYDQLGMMQQIGAIPTPG
jgi:steroid delta-isomerase-like uncharacterized protein